MKKFFAGLGVVALVAIGATATSVPTTAASVQPVAETVAVAEAVVTAPEAVLTYSKPVVETVAAPEAPVAVAEAPVPPVSVQPVAVAPVAVQSVPVAVCEEDQPCWDCRTMGNRICGPVVSDQSTANTVPARREDVPLGGAWAGISEHYAPKTADPLACPASWYQFTGGECIDPATVKGHETPVTDSNPVPPAHAEYGPNGPTVCRDTKTIEGPASATECK